MCLTVENNAKPIIAKKDKRVYILAIKRDGKYYTYFQEAKITPKMRSGIDEPIYGEIGKALHSLFTKKDAKKVHSEFERGYGNIVILTCIIPKGATYYKGKFELYDSSVTSYASNKRNLILPIKETKI